MGTGRKAAGFWSQMESDVDRAIGAILGRPGILSRNSHVLCMLSGMDYLVSGTLYLARRWWFGRPSFAGLSSCKIVPQALGTSRWRTALVSGREAHGRGLSAQRRMQAAISSRVEPPFMRTFFVRMRNYHPHRWVWIVMEGRPMRIGFSKDQEQRVCV